MPDVFTREKRSDVMSRIRGKNTKPELLVRKFLFSKGYRFRIHQNSLPGKPDIVLKKHRAIVFIHGCFWHGHSNCKFFKMPKSNRAFWKSKIDYNVLKDSRHKAALKKIGWRVITIWECQLKSSKRENTYARLCTFIERQSE